MNISDKVLAIENEIGNINDQLKMLDGMVDFNDLKLTSKSAFWHVYVDVSDFKENFVENKRKTLLDRKSKLQSKLRDINKVID